MNIIHDKLTPTLREAMKKLSADHDRVRRLARDHTRKVKVGNFALERLGSGSFSSAYALDEDWVVRVEFNDENNYRRWADFCLKTRNQHLPKIAFHGVHNGYALTVVERLQPVDSDLWERSMYVLDMLLASGDSQPLTDPLKGAVSRASFKRLAQRAKAVGLDLNDIHTGNVMLRKCGRMVLTDPIA